jgi:hypothetical protein
LTTLTVAEVAARLGVGRSRVHALDAELCPTRCACGQRRYTEASVSAYEARRAVARETLSKQRADRMRALREKFQPRRRFAAGNVWPWRR